MITLANLKIYLKISDTSQDNQLNLAITNAKWFLEAYLWYSLELDAAKIAIFYWYSSDFELKYAHINAVSKIETSQDEFSDVWTEYPMMSNTKIFLERWLVRTRNNLWPVTRITYSFGYDSTTCPEDLAAILYDIAAMNFKNMWEIGLGDLNAETVDWDQISYKWVSWTLSENTKNLLDKYKQYGFSA